ncbi:MAG: Na+/H+ antiporter subunit D [Chloroflexota bacterium]
MNWSLSLPVLVPFTTAILLLLAWNRPRLQHTLNVAGAVVLLGAAANLLFRVSQGGIQSMQIGNWPAPFGITLVADLLSSILVALTGLVGLSVAVYSLADIDPSRERFGYYPLLHVLLMGVTGAFLTGDIFNLYVWFEVMLMASFVLLTLGGRRDQLEGGIKYVTLNLLSSALFLASIGMLYGLTGTLNMAHMALILPSVPNQGMVTVVAMMFLAAFGIKSAIFPLFFWLPASYHTAPASIGALFSGLLTKVGVYSLIRVFTLLFVNDINYTHTILMWVAALTMSIGVLGTVIQTEIRRLLSFHIVSQIGYILMGLALFTPLALAGSTFYLIHIILAKSNLFLIGGLVYKLRGTYQLKKLGGLYLAYPLLAALFLVPALSLAGIPPLSGFWAKLTLIMAGLKIGQYGIVATALGVSLLTLFSMTKIWAEAFWKDAPPEYSDMLKPTVKRGEILMAFLPVVMLAALTLIIGLWAEPLLTLSSQAAEQLLNPENYIQTVLGGSW